MKKKLTAGRRARIVEILEPLGEGVGIRLKARKIAACLGEPCSYRQGLSLLGQFSRRKKPPGKTAAQINEERFQQMKALRKDLY